MFNSLKNKFLSFYSRVTSKLTTLFKSKNRDEHFFAELEKILIESDMGLATTRACLDYLKKTDAQDLQKALADYLVERLSKIKYTKKPQIIFLVGVNGTGKTTCAAKLAYRAQKEGNRVLLVAADTFRAAATEQLAHWAKNINVDIVTGVAGQDPASVLYQACEKFGDNLYDLMIIDTAGRLQNKQNLMRELTKLRSVLGKKLSFIFEEQISTLLTIDSMLGQNSLDQARIFYESTRVDGIILTKTDATGKAGIICAIQQELNIPVAYISYGEKIDQIDVFDAREYVHTLLDIT